METIKNTKITAEEILYKYRDVKPKQFEDSAYLLEERMYPASAIMNAMNEFSNQQMEELINKLPTEYERGREGCTYGDTEYDSLSTCYGYNLAIDNIKEAISKY